MKKLLLIGLLAFLTSCIPAPAQNPIYAKLGEDRALSRVDFDLNKEVNSAIKEILCTNVWKSAKGNSRLVFAADNEYRMTIPKISLVDEDYHVFGKWLISPTVLTIIIDENYVENYTIVRISNNVITLLGYDNCPFNLITNR